MIAARLALPKSYMPQHPFDNGELRVRDELLAPFPRTEQEMRKHLADYYAITTHLDFHLGRILDELKQQGLLDKTLIVYTSDHGLAVGGMHGLMGKQTLYEHSARVPCVVRAPGIRPGRRDALTYTPDLHPTLCELAGVPVAPACMVLAVVWLAHQSLNSSWPPPSSKNHRRR